MAAGLPDAVPPASARGAFDSRTALLSASSSSSITPYSEMPSSRLKLPRFPRGMRGDLRELTHMHARMEEGKERRERNFSSCFPRMAQKSAAGIELSDEDPAERFEFLAKVCSFPFFSPCGARSTHLFFSVCRSEKDHMARCTRLSTRPMAWWLQSKFSTYVFFSPFSMPACPTSAAFY